MCLPLHDLPDSKSDGLIHVILTQKLAPLTHFQMFTCNACLDCRLSLPPHARGVYVLFLSFTPPKKITKDTLLEFLEAGKDTL